MSDPDQKRRREQSMFHNDQDRSPNYRSNKQKLEEAKAQKRRLKQQRRAA